MFNKLRLKAFLKASFTRLLKNSAYLLLVLFLSACEMPIPPIATPRLSSPTPDQTVHQAIQAVLDAEVRVRQAADPAALRAILDPQADPEWHQTQLDRSQSVAQPTLKAIHVERIHLVEAYALVAVIIEDTAGSNEPEASSIQRTYALRTLRNLGDEGWKLTVPTSATWGERQTLRLPHLHLSYYPFDKPYVQAVSSQIAPFLAQMAQDFGISLADKVPLTVQIVPAKHLWDETAPNQLPSPLAAGFTLSQAASPEEFLLGLLGDFLGHRLFDSAFGITPQDEGQFRLGHLAIQWEVNELMGDWLRQQLFTNLQETTEIAPLAVLLDPAEHFVGSSGKAAQRESLIYFIVERYGREAIAPFLQAVFTENDWQGIIQTAFGEDPTAFEQAWQQWLDEQLRSPQ